MILTLLIQFGVSHSNIRGDYNAEKTKSLFPTGVSHNKARGDYNSKLIISRPLFGASHSRMRGGCNEGYKGPLGLGGLSQ